MNPFKHATHGLLTRFASLHSLARRLAEHRLARSLARPGDYAFTTDSVSPHEASWNRYLEPFRNRGDLRLLEIGCYEGRSTVWFLNHILTHPTATITCVDPFRWPLIEARFNHNIKVSGHPGKVTKIVGLSEDVLASLDKRSFDIVYIDGSHDAVHVILDAMSGWLLLKRGGIIIFDDYGWKPEHKPAARPQLAIDVFLEVMGDKVSILHQGYQVILQKP